MAIGSFGALTQARLGIYSATKGLTVTGNNISNINTVGYTRQALNQVSLYNNGSDRYQSASSVRIGNGALVKSVSQLRDPYLDIRYRTESSIVGYTNTMLENMTSIADIIDEVGKGDNKGDGIIFAQFGDFISSLERLNSDAAAQSNDTLARTSADTLTSLFHFYADKLEKLERDTADRLKQEVAGLNGVLSSIQDLNIAIRKSEIHGDPALEMRDERNRLLDDLSEYVKVEVSYTMEDVGAGQQVEKLTVKLGNANPDPSVSTDTTVLIDGIYARQFSMPDSFPVENPDYNSKYELTDPPDPDDIQQYKYLKADGTGTNDPLEAEQIPNSNYDITLSKLLDSNGREWSNIRSSSISKLTYEEAKALGAPMKAVYAYTLGGELKWNDPNADPPQALSSITIDGENYYIGRLGDVIDPANPDQKITSETPHIAPGIARNASKLASFIADKLGQSEKYADYDITTDGATIYFTAKKAGAVGQLKDENGDPLTTDNGDPVPGSGPAEAPVLTLTNGGTNLTLTPGLNADDPDATDAVIQEGSEGDPTIFPPDPVENNSDGSRTITTYTMRGANWYETTIVNEYSKEIPMDDNDLYGAIQALRETLTEAGEFSTADTVANIDENAATKRGIPYYHHSLDLLARVFANTFNEANNGYAVDQDDNYLNKSGKAIQLAGEPLVKGKELSEAQQKELLTHFLTQNCSGIDEDGFAVGKDGKQLTLGGEPVRVATPPATPADPDNPTEDETNAQTDWGNFQEAVKGIKDGKFVNKDGDYIDSKGDKIDPDGDNKGDHVAADVTALSTEQQKALNGQPLDNYLTAQDADKMGGNLFSNRGDLDDAEGITAANISVSHSWSTGDVHIVNTFTKLFGGEVENTTQPENISHMVSLMGAALVYDPSTLVDGADSTHLFQGSFQDMLVNMHSVLGNDQREMETQVDTAYAYQVEMDTSRDSVSAVDLNDEAMNLMQYSKSLNAAYRLMTAIDEALDRLINNTGLVGR